MSSTNFYQNKLNYFFNDNSSNNLVSTKHLDDLELLFSSEQSFTNKGLFYILIEAINFNASDIHFESFPNFFKVRFRINGLLKEVFKINKNFSNNIISKIKILSSLDIVEKKRPQDGRFSLKYKEREIDFRTSVIPTINGEKIVVRILDKFLNNFNIENLFLSEENKNIFYNAINKNSGIILINGPTGSGKSTTLYSILNYKNSEFLNISTVEDPIEYQLEGIIQTQCKNEIGLDFSTMFRALLRQDPDIIMIGEIRDKETAEIAIKASLTGHLVFSTIHSNDTLGSINRLLNLGISYYLLSLVLIMLASQRLVRTLCPHCKIIDKFYIEKLKSLKYQYSKYSENVFYTHSKDGCEHCMYTGYTGRIPIFELIFFDERNKMHLLKEQFNLSDKIIFKTLLDDAISKAELGIVSLDEIMRQL